ncbi:acyl-CoA thioesterase [Pseudoroseicyclus tamaricis]|uniref:Acyl-CoA thioesterase n=1 Tax=Pseudoroseicyclus tamaricis TaxID=2705421 RepID=A0A6B2JNT9_9RHOB|nr:acyl-CoA thioesterase [Pseudoroseicyclus tamaricis]NDU99649.1 acyl-CoA thioesterase [Pseudoroseicyclus tamaricis]
MYPYLRMWRGIAAAKRGPKLGLWETSVSHHRIWPVDIDIWMELNNGRTLTIYDLGRLPFSYRIGMAEALKEKGWGMTVAGSTTRYRRRVRPFERVELRTRSAGWDARFMYVEQSMWNAAGEAANAALLRMAVVGPSGIVPPAEVVAAMGQDPTSPPLSDWVRAWVTAEEARPWPPMQEAAG